MSNLRALLSFALAVPLAACGDDGGSTTPIDAPVSTIDAPTTADAPITVDAPLTPDAPLPSYDFSCMGNDAPTAATATVTLTGFARELALNVLTPTIQVATGATIKACKDDCQNENELDSFGVDSTGAFTTDALPTGSTPLDGHLRATKNGNWPTRLYPASPLVADQPDVPIMMITNGAVALVGQVSGGDAQLDTNGIVGVFVTDCSNEPVAQGAMVTFTQGATTITTVIDAGQFTSQAAGAFIATNVPPGDVTVSATWNGMQLRAHVVPSVAGTVTTTQIRPGW